MTTDNSYMKVLQEQGVLGGLLFMAGLGGLVVLLALRLARIGVTRRPLGTAALTGFSGFLVLMLMGEYIEQPGKLLAWTLLGVAAWEAIGRGDSGPARERESPARVKPVPRAAAVLVVGSALLAGLVALGLTASRETDFRSSSRLLVTPDGVPNPKPGCRGRVTVRSRGPWTVPGIRPRSPRPSTTCLPRRSPVGCD